MTVKLPGAFLQRMRGMLGDDYDSFVASYGRERSYGLRSNPLKLTPSELEACTDFGLAPVPWAPEGFYYEEGARPGKHPYYHAGLYYIQEPSAMLPAELLEVCPGDRVLDLCAAPGGKTTQLAGKLRGQGIIAANDNSLERVRALAKNVELFGIRNALVMHELPERLAASWPGYFNKILIDAPCSGEGMFRKEEDMIRQWEKHSVERCCTMQAPILKAAAKLLAPGGRMVYSTCTFSPEENEGMIASFLRDHPEFKVVPVQTAHGFAHGRQEWAAAAADQAVPDEAALQTAGTLRLWPHLVRGEGHFAAVLEKSGGAPAAERHDGIVAAGQAGSTGGKSAGFSGKERGSGGRKQPSPADAAADLSPWLAFCADNLVELLPGTPLLFGEHLYLSPYGSPALDGLKAFRPGWPAGMLKRGRFEPSHALALGLEPQTVRRSLHLNAASDEVIRYLKGETLFIEEGAIRRANETPAKGYVLVCVDGFPLGWGKWSQGTLKNEYPAGWRWV
ncbi:MAG: methyltransferase [Paenibacillaceae bacterium]|jgi:NOL1/NOP2/sun family putative RNA methylase|nr:methyltransferase [Paenibacillaceae bacterium]